MIFPYRGGIHPEDKKETTCNKPIEYLPPPGRLVLPMDMHSGAPAEPLVKVGQAVLMGEKIADSRSDMSAPIHAPVSGRVAAIEPAPHPGGAKVLSVIIDNDGNDSLHPGVSPYGSVESLTTAELLSIAREAGLVGMGGAAIPTHAKIRAGAGHVDKLILNGAECEPYVTSDHRIMLEMPEEVVGGLFALMKIYKLSRAMIAVSSNKPDAIAALRRTLPRKDSPIRVVTLPTSYPLGAEKLLIRAVCGREVPPGASTVSVGAAVFNVDTAAALHRAATTGMPLIRRIVTVAGSGVSNPKNLHVRVGTPMSVVFDSVGGFREAPQKIIMGGPMTGVAQHDLAAPVVKATNALLAFSRQEGSSSEKEHICIRCGRCAQACPMRLLPLYLYQYGRKDMLDECERMRLSDCIECGSCAYVCPGRLHLVHALRTAKQKLHNRKER